MLLIWRDGVPRREGIRIGTGVWQYFEPPVCAYPGPGRNGIPMTLHFPLPGGLVFTSKCIVLLVNTRPGTSNEAIKSA